MYYIEILADNKVCSCLYVSLWGNLIHRMHLQACITFHKINLSNYFFINVSSHLYTYPTACHQLVCVSFVYFRCTYWHLLFNLRYNMAYTSFLSQTDCSARYLLRLSSATTFSQVHRILPQHYTVKTETAASRGFIGKWAVASVNQFTLIES